MSAYIGKFLWPASTKTQNVARWNPRSGSHWGQSIWVNAMYVFLIADADAPFMFPCVCFITLKQTKKGSRCFPWAIPCLEIHSWFHGCLGSTNSAAWQQTLLFGGIAWRNLLGKARNGCDRRIRRLNIALLRSCRGKMSAVIQRYPTSN
jgi:hypothetical protein